jgi:regulator of sigma E protease
VDFCLIAAAAANDFTAYAAGFYNIFKVCVGLGFVIFVHELGHFLAAKACGVKCEKFYVGFDIPLPKIFGFRLPSKLAHFTWGETEYGIGILPLGGYVKMLGQDDDPRKFKAEQERAKAQREGTAAVGLADGEKDQETFEEKPAFDPRSYQAKSVPQRMVIISAGVIMNLIFAVIMAAAAYGMGVVYTPTVVGSAPPGSPGWTRGFDPGDKIIQVGHDGRLNEKMRWQQDLMPKIVLNFGHEDMAFLVQRPGESKPLWIENVRPEDRIGIGMPLLGIGSSQTNQLHDPPAMPGSVAAKTKPPLLGGDKVVAINGQPIANYAELQAYLALHPAEELKLTMERTPAAEKSQSTASAAPEAETLEVAVPAQPLRYIGLITELGPVYAVRAGSPAQISKIQAGDEILSINGEPIGNPLTISQRMLKYIGQDVEIKLRRTTNGKAEELTTQVKPEAPRFMNENRPTFGGDLISIEPLGLALPVLPKVLEVAPDSPAAKAKLQPGDEIIGVQFVALNETEQAELLEKYGEKLFEQKTLDENKFNWVVFSQYLQLLPADTKVSVTYRREGALDSVELATIDMPGGYLESRGLIFVGLEEVRTAASMGEAWSLGLRETKDKLVEVANVLYRLVTGSVPAKNMSGAIGIFSFATHEAARGWPRLLIFLTFLSANLALINFLPIPVLDGGHMVFLIWEGITGKPPNENIHGWLLMMGLIFVLGLMVFTLGLDLMRVFG